MCGCGCNQVINTKQYYPSSLSSRNNNFRGCMEMYEEVYLVITKVTKLIEYSTRNFKDEKLFLDIHKQLYYWLRRLENECPPKDEFKSIKEFIENEYTELERK